VEEIRCIFCEKADSQAVIEENGYAGRQCSQCGLIYISPRPTIDEILKLYREDNAYKPAETHIEAELFKRLHAMHNLKIVTSFVKGGAILDIGAGAGYFLDEARKRGFKPYAIELNQIQADFIQNTLKIPCEQSLLNSSSFGDTKFDVVYHCDVISHFFDPISTFKEINEKMIDGSFLIFETGNLGEVNHKYLKLFHRFSYPDHLFFFSTDNLRDLLERTGFNFVKIYRYSLMPELTGSRILATIWARMSKSRKQGMPPDSNNTAVKKKSDVNFLIASFNDSPIKKIIRNIFYYFGYLLRYKLGYILPKINQPQTVIVIAQKLKR